MNPADTPLLLIAWRRPQTLRQVIEPLYSDVNQACRLGLSRAITWFFDQVEEGIILEDDCVPLPDFFPYCARADSKSQHGFGSGCRRTIASRVVMSCITACMPARID